MMSTISYRPIKARALASVLSLLLVAFLAAGCGGGSTTTNGAGTGGTASTTSSALAGGSASADASSATDCPTSNTTSFAKSKFLLHAGLAFGAFHRYLYKPYQAGTFKSGAHGRTLAFVKAGAAALFIKREIRLTSEDVQANPTLCKVIGQPLRTVGDKVQAAVDGLKGGDVSTITALEGAVQSVKSKASSSGAAIQENTDPPLS